MLGTVSAPRSLLGMPGSHRDENPTVEDRGRPKGHPDCTLEADDKGEPGPGGAQRSHHEDCQGRTMFEVESFRKNCSRLWPQAMAIVAGED